jgi:tetratricopeptide (TPR) repeat protein
MSIVKENGFLPVVALEIDEDGKVSRKNMTVDRDSQLENTLLKADYPTIRVATIDIPQQQLDQYQQAMVEHSLGKKIVYEGVEYCLVGASASAKNGKYYAVDSTHAKAIAQRFRFWPEAAMTYFGILVSPCKVCVEFSNARALVVKDHELGTNDCRGWISRSLFKHLHLPDGRFYQFRMSFDSNQAKGSFKVMEDDVANALAADIVIPRSSCKPEYRKPEVAYRCPTNTGRVTGQYSAGRVVVGIREISRELQFSSSYTLIEHAPAKSIETEIKPIAMTAVEAVKNAIATNDFAELFQILGISDEVELFRPDEHVGDSEHTSTEHTVVEAVLKADSTGYWVKHPFVNSHLQRTLARWAFKLCTAGGFTLPAFALADDGYLVLHNGNILCGSDWIPEWKAITSLASHRMLVVRYPIRTKADLLPVEGLDDSGIAELLTRHLGRQNGSVDAGTAAEIIEKQLRLEGTFTLHSETAKKNGGDYDFDWICLVEGRRFPLFVDDRFSYRPTGENTKNKQSKKESPWWNLAQVAYSAKGNTIGSITDLKTSCLAAGRPDLADRCAVELQKALDQLKWGVAPNHEEIAKIRQEVGTAPWLKLKRVKRISDLPMQLPTAPTDKIGELYNYVRKEVYELFADVRPLEDFRGAICGGAYDRDMLQEAGMLSAMYAVNIGLIAEKRGSYEEALAKAQAELDVFPVAAARASKEGANRRRELYRRRNQAQAALHFYEERSRKDLRNLINIIRKWAERKEDRATDWLTALWDIACKSRRWDERENRRLNTGSIAFYAFPQQLVDLVVERTGGRPITVTLPNLIDGEVSIDYNGNVYLVDEVSDGAGSVVRRQTLLLQVPGDGRLITDGGRAYQVRPFAVQDGQSQIRDGRLQLPNTQQRPGIPRYKGVN